MTFPCCEAPQRAAFLSRYFSSDIHKCANLLQHLEMSGYERYRTPPQGRCLSSQWGRNNNSFWPHASPRLTRPQFEPSFAVTPVNLRLERAKPGAFVSQSASFAHERARVQGNKFSKGNQQRTSHESLPSLSRKENRPNTRQHHLSKSVTPSGRSSGRDAKTTLASPRQPNSAEQSNLLRVTDYTIHEPDSEVEAVETVTDENANESPASTVATSCMYSNNAYGTTNFLFEEWRHIPNFNQRLLLSQLDAKGRRALARTRSWLVSNPVGVIQEDEVYPD